MGSSPTGPSINKALSGAFYFVYACNKPNLAVQLGVQMGIERELSAPNQSRELLDEVITLMDRKGHKFARGSDIFWQGEKLALPPVLSKRARASAEAAQNFHISAQLSGATALNELAIVTFTSLGKPVEAALAALRYKIVPRTSLQDLSLECHEIESLFPKIPSEREVELLEMNEGHSNPSDFPVEGLDNPLAFVNALFESINVNIFRHEIEIAEREAKARALGEFATTAAEADELTLLVRSFAEA